jgi:hypothetical protein
VLWIVHRVIAGFLLKQAGLKRATADTGAVTFIQRFGSAANLNIHLHCSSASSTSTWNTARSVGASSGPSPPSSSLR